MSEIKQTEANSSSTNDKINSSSNGERALQFQMDAENNNENQNIKGYYYVYDNTTFYIY